MALLDTLRQATPEGFEKVVWDWRRGSVVATLLRDASALGQPGEQVLIDFAAKLRSHLGTWRATVKDCQEPCAVIEALTSLQGVRSFLKEVEDHLAKHGYLEQGELSQARDEAKAERGGGGKSPGRGLNS